MIQRGKGWSFAWFPNREDAEAWVKTQKELEHKSDFIIDKHTIFPTEQQDLRACVEGYLK